MSPRYSLVGLMMVAACAAPARDAAPVAVTPVQARDADAAVTPVQSRDADAVVAAGDALLEAEPLVMDGQRHAVYLDDARVLHVGAATIAVDHIDPASNGYHWREQARLSVASFAAGQPAVVLATPTMDSEDPPNRYQVFLIEDTGLTRVFDRVAGAYGVHPARLPGDRTIRLIEDGWTACERLKHPREAVMQEVVYRLDPETGLAVEADRNDTAKAMVCDELSG